MNENNNNQNDQPKEKQKLSDESEPKLRVISKEELKKILEKHKKWVETKGKEGKKADLTCVNLQESNLGKANLSQADMAQVNLQKSYLWETDLQEADLQEANFRQADLGHANLQKANLLDANLQKADLYKTKLQQAQLNNANFKFARLEQIKGLSEATLLYANFEGATGLLGNEFAQSDVTGTKLPDGIKEFKALETVKETSQNARKVFFSMLLGCVYSWLTIATTTDVKLLTNTASSPLPIIGTEIPIAWFYIAAPLVLICLYFYFHLYLIKLWEALSGLPAIFPDGKRLDEIAYPWLLNGLVRRHFKHIKTDRPFIAHVQEWITIFLAWWVVPVTMVAFWLRYLPRHDWIGTIIHIFLIFISLTFGIIFYRLCALTLQGSKRISLSLDNRRKDIRFYYGSIVLIISMFFTILSYGAIEGHRIRKHDSNSLQYIIPWAFNKIGYDVFVDFKEKELSKKPNNYWQLSGEENHYSVKGINFRRTNLNNGDLSQTFLVNADIRDASLCYANFSKANIRYADFTNSILRGADFRGANIHDTEFKNADLREADLTDAPYYIFSDLCKAKTLYKAKTGDRLKGSINSSCPAILEKPKEE